MTSVTSQAQQYSQRELRLKRWVFRRLQKAGSDCADVTWCGWLFQTRKAATGKARSPYVDSRVRRTTSETVTRPNADDVEPRCLPSVLQLSTRSLVVAKRPRDCCVGQFWPNITGRLYFADIIGLSSTNHCDAVQVVQGHRCRYHSKARRPICDFLL